MEYTTTNEFTDDLNLVIFLSINYLMESFYLVLELF